MDPRSQMAALFDRLAESYDAVGVEFFKPIAAGLVAQLAPKEGERVVDVGCGRGAVLIPMARAIAPPGQRLRTRASRWR
jgi:ubiquinone/menaquinone biosynthesis C-methylase UbiE